MREWLGAAALAIAAVAGLAAMSARADNKTGVDAWNRGDYRRAVDEWRSAAIKGDPDAQFNLGQAYKLGRGVPADLAQAETWYRKAALQGHLQAADNYGLALFQEGRRGDALPWLEKSAGRGEPRAQLVLGTMLFNGDGVPRDWVRAYALILRASAAGLPQGSQTLAEMDKYVTNDQRGQAMDLARRYEQQASLPPAPDARLAGGPPPSYPPADYGPPPRPGPGANGPPPGPGSGPKPPRPAPPANDLPPPAPMPGPGAGNWRVQFGTFRDRNNATNLWERLRRDVPGTTALQPYLVNAGGLTKLQAGPLASGADAVRYCARVRAARSECVVVKP